MLETCPTCKQAALFTSDKCPACGGSSLPSERTPATYKDRPPPIPEPQETGTTTVLKYSAYMGLWPFAGLFVLVGVTKLRTTGGGMGDFVYKTFGFELPSEGLGYFAIAVFLGAIGMLSWWIGDQSKR